MINCVIIDDEPKNIRVLKTMLEEFCPQVSSIAEAANPLEGVEVIRRHKPDLVFLDIEMPYGNAFDLLDQLMPVDFEVVFVTAFNNYTLKAIKYSALDYLLKPVNIEELKTAVLRAADRMRLKNINLQLNNLLQNFQKKNDAVQKIALSSEEGLEFVTIGDIIRCQAMGGDTYIYVRGQGKITSPKNIKEYEDMLPDAIFFRIHNSHLINLNAIKKYHRGRGGHVEMEDGSMIEVAIRRKDEFLRKFDF
jgi:two-component system LytT family response regulator